MGMQCCTKKLLVIASGSGQVSAVCLDLQFSGHSSTDEDVHILGGEVG